MKIDDRKYFTIAQFGNLDKFKEQLNIYGVNVRNIINLRDNENMSILEKSLAFRNFDIAMFLLENDSDINVISNEGYNELHYIASNIAEQGALEIAKILLLKGVNINSKDKLGNTPLWYLCNEAIKNDNNEIYMFIEQCFEKNPDITSINNSGYSIKDMIINRKNDRLLALIGGDFA